MLCVFCVHCRYIKEEGAVELLSEFFKYGHLEVEEGGPANATYECIDLCPYAQN